MVKYPTHSQGASIKLIVPGLRSVYFSCEITFHANFVRASNDANYN